MGTKENNGQNMDQMKRKRDTTPEILLRASNINSSSSSFSNNYAIKPLVPPMPNLNTIHQMNEISNGCVSGRMWEIRILGDSNSSSDSDRDGRGQQKCSIVLGLAPRTNQKLNECLYAYNTSVEMHSQNIKSYESFVKDPNPVPKTTRTTNQRKQHHLLSSEQDLVVRVVDPVGDETFFKVKRTTKMAKIFLAYATRKGVDVSSLIFLLDGEPIGETDNANTLEMEDQDQIDCLIRSTYINNNNSHAPVAPKVKASKTAFQFYCEGKREKYSKKYPNASEAALNEIMLEKFNAMPSDRMAKYTDLVAGGRVELASVPTPVALPVPTPVAPPVPTPVAPSVPPSVAPSVPTSVPAQNEESEEDDDDGAAMLALAMQMSMTSVAKAEDIPNTTTETTETTAPTATAPPTTNTQLRVMSRSGAFDTNQEEEDYDAEPEREEPSTTTDTPTADTSTNSTTNIDSATATQLLLTPDNS